MESTKNQVNDDEDCNISIENTPKPDLYDPRIYTRVTLLNLRTSKEAQKEPDEKTFCCASKVILKVLKPECKLSQKQSRAQDHSGIVLGPQKRSWNIGCHVSQPKRGLNEISHGSKQSKALSDRHFSKQPENKRENKASDRVSPTGFRGRDKAHNKPSISGSLFSRPYGQSNNRNRGPDSFSSEKEPEWFSEGPATINDTVELVGMMDENVESCKENNALTRKLSEQKAENDSATNLPVEDSAVISVSVKEEIPTIPKPASAGNADLDFLKMLDQPKPEATGSRFRHLFTKAEQTSPTENTEDINTKLRKLKAGVDKAASPLKPLFDKPATGLSQTQPTASELETALRSLLLGKTAAGSVPNVSMDTALTRNTAPTVQEIEAAVLHASSDSRNSLGNRDVLQPLCLSSIQDKQTPDRNLTATDAQSWMSTTNADVRPPNLPFDMTPLTTPFAQTQSSRQQLNLLSSLEPRQPRDPSMLSKLQGTYSPNRVSPPKVPDQRRTQWEEVLSSAAGQKGALNGLLSKMNAAYSTAAERVPGCLPPPPPLYAHCPPFPSTSTNTTALLPPDPAVQPNRRPIVKSFQFIDESGDSRMQNTRSDMPVVPPPPGLPSYNRTHAHLATGMTFQSFRDLEAILQWNLKQQQQRQADCRKNFPVSAPSAPQFFSRYSSLSNTSAPQMLPMPQSGLTASAGGGGGPTYIGQSHFAQLESFVSKASASTPGMKPNFNSPELPMRWQNQLPLDNQAGGSFSTTDLFRSVTEVEALANKGL